MAIPDILADALARLEAFYGEMSGVFAPPILTGGDNPHFRHAVQTDTLACFLKGVKLVSTLNAALILYEQAYPQEVGALCRMADDFANEIMFILVPGEGTEMSKSQRQFLENFFQEELDKRDDPLGSKQKRETVSAKTIHAAFAKLAATEVNPSDAQEMLRTTQQAFSGYIHGAYPHIMELYGGNPGRFHLSGMPNTPTIAGWERQLVGYVYRAIMITVLVARKVGCTHLDQAILLLKTEYERATGCATAKTAAQMLKTLKKKPSKLGRMR